MPLTNLTQITGPGIKTTTNLQVNDDCNFIPDVLSLFP